MKSNDVMLSYRNYLIGKKETEYGKFVVYCAKSNARYKYAGQKYCRYTNNEEAIKILKYLRNKINTTWRRKQQRINDRKEIKTNFVNPYKIGDILYTSWGYDQTNVDFYQVTSLGKMSIGYKSIKATSEGCGFMAEYVKPIKDSFIGTEKKAIIQVYKYENTVKCYVKDSIGHSLWNTDINEKHYASHYA